MPKQQLTREEKRALRAVKRVPKLVEELKALPAQKELIKRMLRRVRRHIEIIAPTFLPQPLQEALERAHDALVACRLVLEDWQVITPKRRADLLHDAELMAKSAVEIIEREGA
ncbi:MAG TPA: hypothetical protein EYP10_01135 [Armatimonadetes bacterium]|nr:hypothetical protein [Armatimonadota bacterium]